MSVTIPQNKILSRIFFTFFKNSFILFFSTSSKAQKLAARPRKKEQNFHRGKDFFYSFVYNNLRISRMSANSNKVEPTMKQARCLCPCHLGSGVILHVVPCCGPLSGRASSSTSTRRSSNGRSRSFPRP